MLGNLLSIQDCFENSMCCCRELDQELLAKDNGLETFLFENESQFMFLLE